MLPIQSVWLAVREIALAIKAAAILPLFWGLIYLSLTSEAGLHFILLALVFSLTLYQTLCISFHRYYHRQAVEAINAVCELHKRYKLLRADILEFIGVALKNTITTSDVHILIAEGNEPKSPPFLNYRAYLQSGGRHKSVIVVSRQTSGQKFFILHELGHLSRTSHYHGLYGEYRGYRLAVTYIPYLCLSPTWSVAGLALAGCLADWFLHGAIRREYIADSFAWSALARSGEDIKTHARHIGAVFRHAKPKDRIEADEISVRKKICANIEKIASDHHEKQHKNIFYTEAIISAGTYLYMIATITIQALTAAITVSNININDKTMIIFIIFYLLATAIRTRTEREARPVYERLQFMIQMID